MAVKLDFQIILETLLQFDNNKKNFFRCPCTWSIYNKLGCLAQWLCRMSIPLVMGRFGFDSPVKHDSFFEIDLEIFSMVILTLLLIQEEHFLVIGERICLSYLLTT